MSPVGAGLARDSGGSAREFLPDRALSLASQLPQGLRCFQFGSVGALVIARLAADVNTAIITGFARGMQASVITDFAGTMYAMVVTDFTSAMYTVVIADLSGPMHTVVVAGFRMRTAATG